MLGRNPLEFKVPELDDLAKQKSMTRVEEALNSEFKWFFLG